MMPATGAAISASGVAKVVGEDAGLRGAGLTAGTTQVTALLGPGGAGKPNLGR